MNPFESALDPVLTADPRYSRGAYEFLREALEHTQTDLVLKEGKPRHVSGPELLDGIRALALDQFGPMALTVLDDWGVRTCSDWGEIVFNLIEHQVLTKTDRDSKADFQGGYDFYDAFRKPFQPKGPTPGAPAAS